MISEYLMKGIDSLFSKGLSSSSDNNSKPFSKEIIKSNLKFVVKEGNRDKCSSDNDINGTSLNKSRLRTILEKNKQAQIKSVIKRDNSRSLSPYQRISPKEGASPLKEQAIGDKIMYYREQRKTIQKSRVLQKSRLGGSGSRIFRVGSQLKVCQNTTASPCGANKPQIKV